MFQTQVNQFMARGIEGEYADDSPRRETGYVLVANSTAGAAAVGSLTFVAQPANNDTVTIGSVVFRFVNELTQANDIKIGAALTNTIASLEKTINGEGVEGTDYAAGTTTPLTNVIASVAGSVMTLTALEEGLEGNAIALASSDDNVTVAPFAGGALATERLPRFACAFTHTDENGICQLGGEGEFAGVLVNPKMYVNYMNLRPTLELPNGSQGGLCTMGHIYVKSSSAYAVGNIAAYDKTTGRISAYVNQGAVPANAVVIPHAKFIKYSGQADEVACLQLGD